MRRVAPLEGKRTVGLAKHLCGAATDLALVALAQLPRERLAGVAIATCCHHRCEWQHYVGRQYFADQLGLAPSDFAKITRWSSWATTFARPPCVWPVLDPWFFFFYIV